MMTSTVTEVTIVTISSVTYNVLSSTLGIIAILLLLALLVQKELVRASGSTRAKMWMEAADIAIVPLLITFVVIVVTRFVNLIR